MRRAAKRALALALTRIAISASDVGRAGVDRNSMYAVAAPVAVATVVLVVRSLRRGSADGADAEDAESAAAQGATTIVTDVVDDSVLLEAGVPLVSDLVEWLDAAAERLAITRRPVLMRVQNGDEPCVCLDFAAGGVDLKLWIAGPEYMGSYPRLASAGDTEKSVVLEERSAVALERAVAALARA
jgi:hypothetical protein